MQMASQLISVVAAARPHPGEKVSGDAWRVDHDGNRCRIAVIDGLGHGADAAVAANAALEVLATYPDLDPATVLKRCHHALHNTRGAAMAVVLIDLETQRLTFAGVGNVEARLRQLEREHRLSCARGIIGSVLPSIRSEELTIEDGWRLVMYTDGVSRRFTMVDLLENGAALQDLSDVILTDWGRMTDDATVVVAGVEPVSQ